MRAPIRPLTPRVRGAAWLALALFVALVLTRPGLQVLWRLVSRALIAVVALALTRPGAAKARRLATLTRPAAVFLARAAFEMEQGWRVASAASRAGRRSESRTAGTSGRPT